MGDIGHRGEGWFCPPASHPEATKAAERSALNGFATWVHAHPKGRSCTSDGDVSLCEFISAIDADGRLIGP